MRSNKMGSMVGDAARLVHGVCWFIIGFSAGALYMFLLLSPSLPLIFTFPPLRRPAMKFYRWWTGFVIGQWFSLMLAELEFIGGVRFHVYGMDSLPSNEDALVVCNHRCRADWLFLHGIGLRTGKQSQLRIVTKDDLKPLAVFGWAMQMGLFIFMKRTNVNQDLTYMKKMVNYLRRSPNGPGFIVLFPEGTDLNDVSVASSVRYAEKMGIERTHYTMHPRVRGFSQAAQCLTDRTGTGKRIDAVYNVTMAYDDFSKGERPSEISFLRGRFPHAVHFIIHRIPGDKFVEILESDKEGITGETWVREQFALKEEVLKRFYEEPMKNSTLRPRFSEPECLNADQKAAAVFEMKRAVYFYVAVLICAFVLLQFAIVRWCIVFSACILTLLSSIGGGLEVLEANVDDFFRSMKWKGKKNV